MNTDVFRNDAPTFPGLPERYAVFFGNFAPWQGIDVLIDAFESQGWPPDLPLVFVGDGAMQPHVEAAGERNPGRLLYLGHVPYLEMASVVANATLSVVPIDSAERAVAGFSPLKFYESMASGTPVVVSDTGGLGGFVRRCGCGSAFQPGDASDLARAVAELAASAELLATTGAPAREVEVSECSWEARAHTSRRGSARGVCGGRPFGSLLTGVSLRPWTGICCASLCVTCRRHAEGFPLLEVA